MSLLDWTVRDGGMTLRESLDIARELALVGSGVALLYALVPIRIAAGALDLGIAALAPARVPARALRRR